MLHLVPVNQVGDYYEGVDGNTTLPLEYSQVKSLTILDSGAGVDIATKSIWRAWEKQAIKRTRKKLQLVDGHLAKLMGLLEQVVLSSCGTEFVHTLDIVKFGLKSTYNIILGRPS